MKKILTLLNGFWFVVGGVGSLASCSNDGDSSIDQLVGKERFLEASAFDVNVETDRDKTFSNYEGYKLFPNKMTTYALNDSNNPLEHMRVTDGDIKFDNTISNDGLLPGDDVKFDLVYLYSNEPNFGFNVVDHNEAEIINYLKTHVIAVVCVDITYNDFMTYLKP